MKIGYARVSTDEQNLDLQLDALKEVGCEKIFMDQGISGITRERAGLSEALGAIGKEDILIVWNLTRKWGCGAVKVSCEEYVIGGYIGDWLMITGWAKRWVLERFQKQGKIPPIGEDFFRLLVEENVRLQVKHLAMMSMLRGQ